MIIQHNMTAANTNRQLGITNSNLAKSSEKLASGYRINRAGDDAAGLSISEKMRAQIRGLNQASTNAQDGISLIQTAEGAMNEIHSILQRMRELTVQAANDTNVSADRTAITKELKQLTSEIDRIASTTEFNTMKLINGSFDPDTPGEIAEPRELYLQVGANENQEIHFKIYNLKIAGIVEAGEIYMPAESELTDLTGFEQLQALENEEDYADSTLNPVANYSEATKFISAIDAAIAYVSSGRSELGAMQNRLEHAIANTDNTSENLQAAESRIRDVDMAEEMVRFSKDGILQQAAQSMLAQANQSPQGVLSLLQG